MAPQQDPQDPRAIGLGQGFFPALAPRNPVVALMAHTHDPHHKFVHPLGAFLTLQCDTRFPASMQPSLPQKGVYALGRHTTSCGTRERSTPKAT